MSGYTVVYSKYHEQRINDLTSTVASNKADIEGQLNNYKASNDARASAIETAHSDYVASNNARVSSLETTVSANKDAFDAYKASNDARADAIEAQAVADKAELQGVIADNKADIEGKLLADKNALQANIDGVDARLTAVENEVGDKVNDYLNSNIDQRVLTTTFEAVKSSLEAQDSAFATELSSKMAESVGRHNAQAEVTNELIRLMKALFSGMHVEDADGNVVSPDDLKLIDTTEA